MKIISNRHDIESPKDAAKKDTRHILRGKRLAEIRARLSSKDLDERDRLLKYSQDIGWFIDRLNELYLLMEQARPNYSMTPNTHGLLNGIILAIAIFMEDESPPLAKRPENYSMLEPTDFEVRAKQYIERAESLLADLHERTDNEQVRAQIEELMDSCWIETKKQKKIRLQVRRSNEKREEQ